MTRSVCAPRWATPRDPSRRTLGAAAAKIAVELGTPLMKWQRQVLDVALEIDQTTGKLAYRQVVLTVPRQSGKTTLLLALILLRALGAPRQQIRYTAQTGADARKKMRDDWTPALEPTRFGALFQQRQTNGHEAWLFGNGSLFALTATTRRAGHGGTLDLGILDEAFAQPDWRIEQALLPAMITRPMPQLWVVSTAGTPADSPYLMEKVQMGREVAETGLQHSVAYFEWSADDHADPADPDTWASCMPALGHTVSEAAVRADFESLDSSEFARAYLNRWMTLDTAPVIALDAWNALGDPTSSLVDPVCFAFDVTPDRSAASIAVAGARSDGLKHVELVAHRPGTDWVVDALEQLRASHKPSAIVADATGPAGSLLAELAARKVDITTVSASDHAQACGLLFDGVAARTLRHRGSPEILAALDGARKRPLGDAWAWSRKNSTVDISPLVASTLALWAAQQKKKPTFRIY
jgi:phage terminase large subunit-like protein